MELTGGFGAAVVELGPALVKSPQISCCSGSGCCLNPPSAPSTLNFTPPGGAKRIAPGGGGNPPKVLVLGLEAPSPSFF